LNDNAAVFAVHGVVYEVDFVANAAILNKDKIEKVV